MVQPFPSHVSICAAELVLRVVKAVHLSSMHNSLFVSKKRPPIPGRPSKGFKNARAREQDQRRQMECQAQHDLAQICQAPHRLLHNGLQMRRHIENVQIISCINSTHSPLSARRCPGTRTSHCNSIPWQQQNPIWIDCACWGKQYPKACASTCGL